MKKILLVCVLAVLLLGIVGCGQYRATTITGTTSTPDYEFLEEDFLLMISDIEDWRQTLVDYYTETEVPDESILQILTNVGAAFNDLEAKVPDIVKSPKWRDRFEQIIEDVNYELQDVEDLTWEEGTSSMIAKQLNNVITDIRGLIRYER
jgi:hypothetical protein